MRRKLTNHNLLIMPVKRTVPNIESQSPRESIAFYEEFMGMKIAMDRDWIITFVSEQNPMAQINVIRNEVPEVPHPDISIEVEDVDTLFARAKERGIYIVYPLTDEPWGVRRFFVKDPSGKIVNILSHH